MQVNMFILHCFPKSFNENIITPGTLAIHADPDIVVLEILGKSQASELAALVGVHDFGFAVPGDRFFERIQTKAGVHRD